MIAEFEGSNVLYLGSAAIPYFWLALKRMLEERKKKRKKAGYNGLSSATGGGHQRELFHLSLERRWLFTPAAAHSCSFSASYAAASQESLHIYVKQCRYIVARFHKNKNNSFLYFYVKRRFSTYKCCPECPY
jgi:hypothetical protein